MLLALTSLSIVINLSLTRLGCRRVRRSGMRRVRRRTGGIGVPFRCVLILASHDNDPLMRVKPRRRLCVFLDAKLKMRMRLLGI